MQKIKTRKISSHEIKEACDKSDEIYLAKHLDHLKLELFSTLLKSWTWLQLQKVIQIAGVHHFSKKMKQLIDQNLINLREYHFDKLVLILRLLPSEIREQFLNQFDSKIKSKILYFISFSVENIGYWTQTNLMIINDEMNVKNVREFIKDKHHKFVQDDIIFVTDKSQKLMGFFNINNLINVNENTNVKQLIKPIKTVDAFDHSDINLLAKVIDNNGFVTVVDKDKKLLGIILASTMLMQFQDDGEIYAEESEHKIFKRFPVLKIFKNRFWWIIILMIGATLGELMIVNFMGVINNNEVFSAFISTAVVSLIPIISDSAEVTGKRSGLDVIKVLSLGYVKRGYYKKSVSRELETGLIIGVLLMLINFFRLIIFFIATGELGGENDREIWIIAAASSISLLLVILLSKFVATSLPFVIYRFGKLNLEKWEIIIDTIIHLMAVFVFYGVVFGLFFGLEHV